MFGKHHQRYKFAFIHPAKKKGREGRRGMKDRPIARPRWMESVEASKGPERETIRPRAHRRTGPVMQRRNGDNDIRSKPWRERWREQKRNKWARWVTARRKSRANGCLNARSARSALPRTSFPVVPTLATSEKFNNPTNGLAVAYYSYTHDPCGRVAANSILNGVTIEFRPWIIGDLPQTDPPEIFHPHSFLAFILLFNFRVLFFFFFFQKNDWYFNFNFIIEILKMYGFGWFYRILMIVSVMNSLFEWGYFIIAGFWLKLNFALFIHTRVKFPLKLWPINCYQ